jgi:hypothetical protein
MRGRLAAAAVLATLISMPAVSTSALAQGRQDFMLVNRTGYTIEEVYVAPSKSTDWEEDVMGRDVLNNGETVTIRFPGSQKTCKWDLKVVYEDTEEAEWQGFNLCEVSKIALRYNRKSGETWADYE